MLKNNNENDKKLLPVLCRPLEKNRKEIKQKTRNINLMTRKFEKIRFFFDFFPHFRLYKQEIREIINWINKLKLTFECDLISPHFSKF